MAASRAHLRTILTGAVQDGVTPGAVVLAGRAGTIGVREVVGLRQKTPAEHPADLDTVWDLASLTKPLVTSLLTMRAVHSGAISLDEPLSVAPEGADRTTMGAITVRWALAHAAGFAAHLPFWSTALGEGGTAAGTPAARAAVIAAAARAPLAYPPGTRSLYSDLDFILLGDLLERRLGDRIDRLAAGLGPPHGTAALGYCPIGEPSPVTGPFAATQACPTRGRVAVGEVDDLNAYAMGGVSGHAGLFGTVDAVASIANALLAAYRGAGATGGAPIVDREVLRLFWTPAGVPGSRWCLGWDRPGLEGSLAGDRLSRDGVGHLGFTGVSLWLDPERETFVTLLTNRVHPAFRDDPRFRTLRRTVNDVALELVGY